MKGFVSVCFVAIYFDARWVKTSRICECMFWSALWDRRWSRHWINRDLLRSRSTTAATVVFVAFEKKKKKMSPACRSCTNAICLCLKDRIFVLIRYCRPKLWYYHRVSIQHLSFILIRLYYFFEDVIHRVSLLDSDCSSSLPQNKAQVCWFAPLFTY